MSAKGLNGGGWLLVAAVLAALGMSGCATPRWGDIVSEQKGDEVTLLYTRLAETSGSCSSSFDGELKARFDTQLENLTYGGYFQMLEPSFLKLVISNPLGQPMVVISSNARLYQVLNTTRRTFRTVMLRSFCLRNNIPPSFMRGHWFAWLTGRPLPEEGGIRAVREDPGGRGSWLEIGGSAETGSPLEYVLLELSGSRILERIIVAEDGSSLATISYGNWETISGCEQPMAIGVSGLSFGATADFLFSDLREAEFEPRDFNLPFPPGYSRQFLP